MLIFFRVIPLSAGRKEIDKLLNHYAEEGYIPATCAYMPTVEADDLGGLAYTFVRADAMGADEYEDESEGAGDGGDLDLEGDGDGEGETEEAEPATVESDKGNGADPDPETFEDLASMEQADAETTVVSE